MASIQSRDRQRQFLPTFESSYLSGDQYGPAWFQYANQADRIPEWSIYPAARDALLRRFWKQEPIISGAVYSIMAKMKSIPREFVGPLTAVKQANNLFELADFENGWMHLLEKTIQDMLTQDNGYFWEIIGYGSPAGPLLGYPTAVAHIDPAQCFRTFDPVYPVVYVDPVTNERHKLHHTRVHCGASMPQSNELARGIGYSPLSRALARVRLARDILTHRQDVVSGNQKRAIIHGKGVSARTLKRALNRADAEADQEELTVYQSIPILTTAQGVELNMMTLAGLPDGYNMVDEHNIYVYIVALDFGVDARELWPATVSGATKADASVQHMKARGKGFADILSELEFAHYEVVKRFSPKLRLVHDFVDDERDQMVSAMQSQRTSTYSTYVDKGAITAKEMRALAINDGILNASILDNIDTVEGMSNFEEIEETEQDAGAVVGAEDGIEEQPGFDEENDPAEDKAYRRIKTETIYEETLKRLARKLWEGSFDALDFVEEMDYAIREGLTNAVYDVLASLNMTPAELSFEERVKLLEFIGNNVDRVWRLASWIEQNRRGISALATIYSRIQMWARQYRKTANFFKKLLGGTIKYKWIWSPKKEHCKDCEKLNGRVYRANVWVRYDIEPQSPRLACGGYRCGCDLIPTTENATPGRPPNIG